MFRKLLALTLCICTLPLASSAVAQKVVKVGVIVPLTGASPPTADK